MGDTSGTGGFGGTEPSFGYVPPPPKKPIPAGQDPSPSASAPDFRTMQIGQHAGMLQAMSDAAAHAAAEMWGSAATLLETTRGNLLGYGQDLKSAWRSSAATPFFERIGSTLSSLEAWAEAARVNETRLHDLGQAIQTAQTEMEALYASYKTQVAEIDKDEFGPTVLGIDKDKDDMKDMVNEKTAQSLVIMERLAGVLVDTTVRVAGKFTGPTSFNPGTGPGAPGAPGGPGGAAPQAPGGGAAPGGIAPVAPKMPTAGPPPVVPLQPRPVAPLSPLTATPMAALNPGAGSPFSPRGLGAPPAPPNAVSPGTMSTSALAGVPPAAPVIGSAGAPTSGLGGTRGTPPAAPTIGSGTGGAQALRGATPRSPGSPMASSPGSALQGRNAAQSPGAMPPGGGRGAAARPQIPGRSAGRGMPGMAPPGGRGVGGRPPAPSGRGMPGAPGLQGRQAARPAGGQPGGMAPPNSGVPRSLQGSRGEPEGSRTGRSPSGRAPIRPGTPGSAGMPGLRGRSGPVRAARSETAQTVRAALRRGLGGPGMGAGRGPASAAATGPTGRPANGTAANRREDTRAAAATAPQMVGDEKLFAADPAAPAVIERKQEKVHAKRPGPALGRG